MSTAAKRRPVTTEGRVNPSHIGSGSPNTIWRRFPRRAGVSMATSIRHVAVKRSPNSSDLHPTQNLWWSALKIPSHFASGCNSLHSDVLFSSYYPMKSVNVHREKEEYIRHFMGMSFETTSSHEQGGLSLFQIAANTQSDWWKQFCSINLQLTQQTFSSHDSCCAEASVFP